MHLSLSSRLAATFLALPVVLPSVLGAQPAPRPAATPPPAEAAPLVLSAFEVNVDSDR
ncbi:MAG: hypothetical protein RLZZ188_2790, partial [Verrucomicrobiota bacterium]